MIEDTRGRGYLSAWVGDMAGLAVPSAIGGSLVAISLLSPPPEFFEESFNQPTFRRSPIGLR